MKNILSKVLLFILIVLILVCMIFDSFRVEYFSVSNIKTDYKDIMKKKREEKLTTEDLILNNYYTRSELSQKELEELNKQMALLEENVYTLQHPPSK
jgi:hypothetical protein